MAAVKRVSTSGCYTCWWFLVWATDRRLSWLRCPAIAGDTCSIGEPGSAARACESVRAEETTLVDGGLV